MIDFNDLQINQAELRARLGTNFESGLVSDIQARLKKVCDGGYIYKKVKVLRTDNGIDLGFGKVCSHALEKVLEGCDNAYLFVATLGHGCERELRRAALVSPVCQFITDAVASALCEAFCDAAQAELDGNTKPRFSPGYSDLPLSVQTPFLKFLEADKKLGITLKESLLMVPTKSVTAIIGIKNDNT